MYKSTFKEEEIINLRASGRTREEIEGRKRKPEVIQIQYPYMKFSKKKKPQKYENP